MGKNSYFEGIYSMCSSADSFILLFVSLLRTFSLHTASDWQDSVTGSKQAGIQPVSATATRAG